MKVLVTAASKHGATAGIAEAIKQTLSAHGVDATLAPIEDIHSVDGYQAVIIGSGATPAAG
jgi:menaquinone-dependent protoporphyrinogen oxidase